MRVTCPHQDAHPSSVVTEAAKAESKGDENKGNDEAIWKSPALMPVQGLDLASR